MLDRFVQFIREQVSDTANPIATVIAQRSLAEIHGLLGAGVIEMSPAETRGYVRARGRHIVNLHTRLVGIEQSNLTQETLELAKSKALQQAVQEVVREVLSRPSTRYNRRAA